MAKRFPKAQEVYSGEVKLLVPQYNGAGLANAEVEIEDLRKLQGFELTETGSENIYFIVRANDGTKVLCRCKVYDTSPENIAQLVG
jgi:hypothetical protein